MDNNTFIDNGSSEIFYTPNSSLYFSIMPEYEEKSVGEISKMLQEKIQEAESGRDPEKKLAARVTLSKQASELIDLIKFTLNQGNVSKAEELNNLLLEKFQQSTVKKVFSDVSSPFNQDTFKENQAKIQEVVVYQQKIQTLGKNRPIFQVKLPPIDDSIAFKELCDELRKQSSDIPDPAPGKIIFIDDTDMENIQICFWDVKHDAFHVSSIKPSEIEEAVENVYKTMTRKQERANQQIVEKYAIKPCLSSEKPNVEEFKNKDDLFFRVNIEAIPPRIHLYAKDLNSDEILESEYKDRSEMKDAITLFRQYTLAQEFESLLVKESTPSEKDFSPEKGEFVRIYPSEQPRCYKIAFYNPKTFEIHIEERSVIKTKFTVHDLKGEIDEFNRKSAKAYKKLAKSTDYNIQVETPANIEEVKEKGYIAVLHPETAMLTLHTWDPIKGGGKEEISLLQLPKKIEEQTLIHTLFEKLQDFEINILKEMPSDEQIKTIFEKAPYFIYVHPDSYDATIFYEDALDKSVHFRKTTWIDVEHELLDVDDYIAFEKEFGKTPPSIQEVLLQHKEKFKKLDPSKLAELDRITKKCNHYARKHLYQDEGVSRTTRKKTDAEATLLSEKGFASMVLPRSIGTKKFASGSFKSASLAAGIYDRQLYAWLTTQLTTSSMIDATAREVHYLTKIKEMTTPESRFLLKPRLISTEYKSTSGIEKMGILTEYCDLGEFDAIKNYDMKTRLEVFKQVLMGVKALHDQDIVHCDLKPGNVLMKTDAKGNPEARVIDFGLCHSLSNNTISQTGTPIYIPLEVYDNKTGNSKSSDIYALGLIAYETVLARPSTTKGVQTKQQLLTKLKTLHNAGLSMSELSAADRQQSRFLQTVHEMIYPMPNQRPKSVDEVILVLDAVLKDETEMAFLGAL